MTRNEAFAATALQGLIAARTNLDIQQEIETAWRYADAMEAVAKQRDILELAAERREDLPVTITAKAAFHLPLMEGITIALESGCDYSNRDRRIIGEVLNAYGCADGAGTSFFGRCELTHCFTDVCQFTFPPRTERTE